MRLLLASGAAGQVPLLHGGVEDDQQIQFIDAVSAQADATATIRPHFHSPHARSS
jgi:hypothetical protein